MTNVLEAVASILLLPISLFWNRRHRRASAWQRKPRRPAYTPSQWPPPYPTAVDIQERPLLAQPENSRFFQLPIELRENIYRHALGGRLIALSIDKFNPDYTVKSRCYELVDDPDTTPNLLTTRAPKLPLPLLYSCRQVYLEALPLLHRSNTFHIWIHELSVILPAAFPPAAVTSHLRSLYLAHTPHRAHDNPHRFNSPWWNHLFARLREMRGLEALVFELDAANLLGAPPGAPYPHGAALDSVWGRGVLSLRNLRHFALFPVRGEGRPGLGFNESLGERMRVLTVGPDAGEFYAAFLALSRRVPGEDVVAALEAASSGYQPWEGANLL